MADQEMIPLAYLIIEGAADYESLLSINIETEANKHGRMVCVLRLVQEGTVVSDIDLRGRTVTARHRDGAVLFTGTCTDSSMAKMSAYAEVTLTVDGLTAEADKAPQGRTFQDAAKTLSSVCGQVMEAYGADIAVGRDLVISQILVQDQETDWAFIVRIANQYGLDVYSDVTAANMRILIGTENARSLTLGDNSVVLEESRNLEELRLLQQNTEEEHAGYEFTGEKVRTYNPSAAAGTCASGSVIRSSSLRSEKGVIVTDVSTQPASSSRSAYRSASSAVLSARVLSGTVIGVSGTKIKVQFDVDSAQDAASAMEIDYENTVNHSFYCMPDLGDKVYAYVDNLGGAVVLGSKRTDLSDPFFEKPEEKAITSLDNLIQFRSSSLELLANREGGTANENTKLSILLDNTEGIRIHAAGGLMVRSLENIAVVASAEENPDIEAKISSEKQKYLEMCKKGHDQYNAHKDDGSKQNDELYDSGASRWFGDFWNDFGTSYENLWKSISLYSIRHKNEVHTNDANETFETGTISIYGKEFCMGVGSAAISMKSEDFAMIYVRADLLSWAGTSPLDGYEIVSDPVKSTWDTVLNFVTVGLDIVASVAMIAAVVLTGPVGIGIATMIGAGAMAISAGISVTRGDYAGALLSLIPFAGAVGKGAKMLDNAPKIAKLFTITTTVVCTAARISTFVNQAKGLIDGVQHWDDLDTADRWLLGLQAVDILLGVVQGGLDVKLRNKKIREQKLLQQENAMRAEMEANANKVLQSAADPVDVVTGALTVSYTDLVTADMTGDFPLVRNYRSVHRNPGGMLGSRWRYNIENALIRNDGVITVCLRDMHKERFRLTDAGWVNAVDGRETYALTETQDGYEVEDREDRLRYLFDLDGRILAAIDRNGGRTGYTYDSDRLTKVKFTGGQELFFHYERGKVTELSDSAGRTVRYAYDGELLTSMTGPNGGTVTYEYTQEGFLTGITNENGKQYVKNRYDRKGRVVRQNTADGGAYVFFYNPAEKQNTVTDLVNNSSVTYCYNRAGLVERILQADGSEKTFRFDAGEHIIYECDELGRKTYRTYSSDGRLLKETLPTGLTTEYSYDNHGNITAKWDNLGRRQEYSYDAGGNRILARYLLDQGRWAENRMKYDAFGRIIAFYDACGGVRTWAYDRPYVRATRYTGPEGETRSYEIDAYGRSMAVEHGRGEITYAFNMLNFITAVTDEEGNTTRYRYDLAGNCIGLIRPNGNAEGETAQTVCRYDCMDRLTETTDPCGNVRAVKVDGSGHVIKEINPNEYDSRTCDGTGIEYRYDLRGNRTMAVYPDGGTEYYEYDACGNVRKVIRQEEFARAGANGAGYTYEYDDGNRLVRVTDTLGTVRAEYEYDAAGRLVKETGAKVCCGEAGEEAATLYSYNLAGWLMEKREPVSLGKTGCTTEKGGCTAENTDCAAEKTDCTAENTGCTAKKENGVIYRLTVYSYDDNGNQIMEKRYLDGQTEKSARGRVLTIQKEYDRAGRLTAVSDSTGARMEYSYNAQGQRITEKVRISGSVNLLRKYTYRKNGLMESFSESADFEGAGRQFRTTWFAYDPNGNLTCITTPSGNEIRREYDLCDRLVKETHLEKGGGIHNTVSFSYDKAGNLTAVTDGLGRVERRAYDGLHRLVLKTAKDGGMTAMRYDKNGNLIRMILPEGYAMGEGLRYGMEYRYDTEDRRIEELDAYGKTVQKRSFRRCGELEGITDASGGGIRFAYDLAGRRTFARTEGGAVSSYEYDVWGNLLAMTDGAGNRTSYELDAWGRAAAVMKADGSMEAYAYDFMGNIIRAADGEGHAAEYAYNAMNRLSAYTDAAGKRETWQYDLEGNVKSHTDRNGVTLHYEYNMYGSVTRLVHRESGYQESFSYQQNGLLSSADSGGRRYEYAYDEMGRLREKRSGNRTLLSYEYDRNGNRKAVTDASGNRVSYGYDRNGRLLSVKDENTLLAEYGYYPDGSMKRVRLGGDLVTEYGYDADKNLTGLKTKMGDAEHGLTLTANTYAYDGNGNVVSKRTLAGLTEYGYNEVNELVHVRYPGRTEELFYDKAGNRTGRVADGVETRYEYDACNRLIRMTGMGQKTGTAGPSENAEDTKNVMAAEFQYDNQGNLLRDERAEYAVDVRNRVVKAELFDGNIQINRYDAEGLRAEVEENGRLTSFVFDGTEAVMEETEGETVRYIRGYRNRIIASDCESARQYYHYACDELGSVTHVITGCGDGECGQRQDERVQNTYEYDAFGNQVKCEENVPNRLCFAGEQYDAVTQQYYLRARFYNPVIGRFTQEDSYHGDGLNLYAYCHNNPMYYVDPSGHDVRAAAEKDYVNKALDAMNGYADKGIDAMMKEAYENKGGSVFENGNEAHNVGQYEKLKSQYAADEISHAERIGSALKDDPSHRAASYLSQEQLESGKVNSFTGGDGKTYTLLQTQGELDNTSGIFEYIVNSSGQVTHQRFIPGGKYTGFPNQVVPKGGY